MYGKFKQDAVQAFYVLVYVRYDGTGVTTHISVGGERSPLRTFPMAWGPCWQCPNAGIAGFVLCIYLCNETSSGGLVSENPKVEERISGSKSWVDLQMVGGLLC